MILWWIVKSKSYPIPRVIFYVQFYCCHDLVEVDSLTFIFRIWLRNIFFSDFPKKYSTYVHGTYSQLGNMHPKNVPYNNCKYSPCIYHELVAYKCPIGRIGVGTRSIFWFCILGNGRDLTGSISTNNPGGSTESWPQYFVRTPIYAKCGCT